MVAVMGPNGSGNSTLLTITGSPEEPTSGEVLIAGQPVSKLPRSVQARLRQRTTGYVFQDFNLLTGVRAVVPLPGDLSGDSRLADRRPDLPELRTLRRRMVMRLLACGHRLRRP
jgi:putative ABC transport system ATP-binding protein